MVFRFQGRYQVLRRADAFRGAAAQVAALGGSPGGHFRLLLDGHSALARLLAFFGGEGGVKLVKSVSDLAVLLDYQLFDWVLLLSRGA